MMARVWLTLVLLAVSLCGGAVERMQLRSGCVPSPASVNVAVPADYAAKTTERYPVVYLLHGYDGDYTTWGKIVNLDSLATAYGVIVVCPDGLNSWYWNVPTDPGLCMEDYIVDELVPWVDATYRTLPGRGGRAITGLSMGGHGGLWLGLRHPDVFGCAGSTSGGVDIRPFPRSWNLASRLGDYASRRRVWDEHTVMSLLDSVEAGVVEVIFDCGTGDFFYEVNCRLHREMNRRGWPHVFLTSPGVHDARYWSQSIVAHFQFFHTYFYCQ